MSESSFIRALLPELSLVRFRKIPDSRVIEIVARKEPKIEYCPRCATPSTTGYDTRTIRLKDEPFRTFRVFLLVQRRRLRCKPCGKVFTEPLGWARKGVGTPSGTRGRSWAPASVTST